MDGWVGSEFGLRIGHFEIPANRLRFFRRQTVIMRQVANDLMRFIRD